jgi:hypothetical protein
MSMYFYVEKSFGGRKGFFSRHFRELFTWSAPYTLLWLHGKQKRHIHFEYYFPQRNRLAAFLQLNLDIVFFLF